MTAKVARNVRTKRVYDEPDPSDGRRIIITRYWPRGIARTAAHEYDNKVSPSKELVQAFKHEGMSWPDYKRRFLAEMKEEPAASEIKRLAHLSSEKPITLLCMCEDDARCHRSLVRQLIIDAD